MTSARYRGFRILSRPYQITESKRWTVDFEIHRHGQHKSFSLLERCDTEKQADARCVWLGRSIIDKRIPGRSIRYLRTAPGRLGRRALVLVATLLLALGTLALRADPADRYPVRLVSRAVHSVTWEIQNIGRWLFDRLVVGPVIGEPDSRIE